MNKRFFMALPVIGLTLVGQGAAYPSDLIYFSTFESAESIVSPKVGAAGQVVRTVTFVPGAEGNAVRIPSLGAGVVVINLPDGLPVEKGVIEFDAKLEATSDSFGSAGNPALFQVCPAGSNGELMNLGFTANNGAGLSGLCTVFGSRSFSSNGESVMTMSYSSIFGSSDYNAWHHYSYVWNTNGISGSVDTMRVYLDGKVLVKGTVPSSALSSFASGLKQALRLCLSRNPDDTTNNQVPYCVDNLKIWKTDTPKEEEDPELPVVSEVTAKQHYPWCGKIDIGYTVAGSTDGLLVKITVKDNDNDVTYEAKSFDAAPTAKAGSHTVVWDATKDGVNKVSKNMVATVSLIVPED